MFMMLVARHAKSSWDYPELSDFERPLSARGRRDAPLMAAILRDGPERPDVIVTSSAVRAVTTARVMAQLLDLPMHDMIISNALYDATADELIMLMREMDDAFRHVMIVGHNPALTQFVNIVGDTELENVPTCGVVTLAFPSLRSWRDIGVRTGNARSFDYPRKYYRE